MQRFIGSSKNGLNSLESRVHGLEMALDEISYDLALSNGRVPNDAADNQCCKMPGTEFLSPKFWRRTEGRFSTSRLSLSGGNLQSVSAAQSTPDDDDDASFRTYENSRKLHHQGGFAMNSFADANDYRYQSCNVAGFDGAASSAVFTSPVNMGSR